MFMKNSARFALGVLPACIVVFAFLITATLQTSTMSQAAPTGEMSEKNLIRAPEFPADADWLNTDKPLSLRALRGKIVLLDFWTYACINCMHILPDLKKLERKYPDELVIIGVHSAKFENESETKNIRNAILRYKIEHPVLNDKTMRVWDEYAVRAWPTLTLISPDGRIVSQLAGEGHYSELDQQISLLIKTFKARGELKSSPMNFALEAAQVENTPLSFPGKVLAKDEQLFIADSNHNRIIVSDLQGNVQIVFGSGAQGFNDGDAAKATFHNPQGMALSPDGSTLYVADTDNHAIRALDLNAQTVTTLAGTGKQAAWRSTGGTGTKAALASPWDVLQAGRTLYIAMAGAHQIWALDLKTRKIAPYAGSAAEARLDGGLKDAALAQPSGLASDGKNLFFADSESSSIRVVNFQNKTVDTVVGATQNPRNLFSFGDKDGAGFDAKLQHPLGVTFGEGKVFVADTYNHKIKILDPQKKQISTLKLNATFNEPGGVSFDHGKLFIADTNNQKIRVVDLKTKTVSEIQFKNLPLALPAEPQRAAITTVSGLGVLPTQTLAPNAAGELVLNISLPAGFKLNTEAPQKFDAKIEGAGLSLSKAQIRNADFHLPLRVPFKGGKAGQSGTLVATVLVNYCSTDNSVCKFKTLELQAPFVIKNGGAAALNLNATIKD
jgi:DNA-binding beta-propeller fold protein YncE